ncbi:hypothetical protein APR12_002694 [Nocardia amikacinitolerans]|nr:hypothetical protein [Nocardia amikacinitolerans]
MAVRLFSGALVGVAAILATTMLAPQAEAAPTAPCDAYSVGNTHYEGTTKWICYSFGRGSYGWIVAG